MINLNVLSQSDYNKLIAKLLEQSESDKSAPYFDAHSPNKYVTIGRGFEIERSGLAQDVVFKVLGLGQPLAGATPSITAAMNAAEAAYLVRIVGVLTGPDTTNAALQIALNAIVAQRAADPLFASIPSITGFTTFTMSPQQIEDAFTAILEVKEKDIDRIIADRSTLVLSAERAALVAMSYQGLAPAPSKGVRLKAAIVTNSDRAEAWYLIRYEGPISAAGDYGRHIAEAQTFGLYEGANTGVRTAGPSESRAIFAMLTRHHEAIVVYESAWGSLAVANAVSRFGVNAADVQFPSVYNPARDAFVTWTNGFLTADKQISADVNPISIYYTPSVASQTILTNASGDDSKAGNVPNNLLVGGAGRDVMYGGTGDDTLIGDSGNDSLDGGEGNDVLVGGAGADTLDGGSDDDYLYGGADADKLFGGSGYDTYKFAGGSGADTIQDSDGQGAIDVEGIGVLTGGTGKPGTDTWKSSDGRVRYDTFSIGTANDPALLYLVISFADRSDTIAVTDWHLGDLGINLLDDDDGSGGGDDEGGEGGDDSGSGPTTGPGGSNNGSTTIPLPLPAGAGEALAGAIGGPGSASAIRFLSDFDEANSDAQISSGVNAAYRTSTTWRPRDPLAIDLDGDGIETTGLGSTPILFDHNADGVRTGTGWVRPDDAWLVLDRNGNGLIDSGSELFGVDTQITVGGVTRTATSGFEALGSLDANSDGLFNAQDAAFTQVRLWQDLNQDGISQSGELSTLSSKNIVSISLTPNTANTNLGNGNTVTGQATVTRSNGSTTVVDSVGVGADSASNLNLADNPFYRQFTDTVPISTVARALPNMQGSGWVHDLREAMSLGTPQAAALLAKVQAFAQATTRDAQQTLLDDVLQSWAHTIPAGQLAQVASPALQYALNGNAAVSAQLQQILPLLQIFNGAALADSGMQAPSTAVVNQQTLTTYNFSSQQATLMQQAYDALRESVYGSLVMQTRLKPYFNAITLQIDATGMRIDTTAISSLLVQCKATDERNTVLDLIDLNRHAGPLLQGAGFDGLAQLRSWLEALPANSALRPELATMGIVLDPSQAGTSANEMLFGNASANTLSAAGGNDIVDAGAGNDTVYGGDGRDRLLGRDGADALYGEAGDDELDGGAGNDSLNGGYGNNTYLFGRGDGQDTFFGPDDGTPGKLNTLQFKSGVAPSDVTASRNGNGNDLVFSIAGTTDKITAQNFFYNGNPAYVANPLQQVRFDDGTTWDLSGILVKAFTAGPGNQTFYGALGSNTYTFGKGDGQDLITGFNDAAPGKLGTLQFKAGVDASEVTASRNGNDLVFSIAGTTDRITAQNFFYSSNPANISNPIQQVVFQDGTVWNLNQILVKAFTAGPGNQTFYGALGSNTYTFGKGDGQDLITGFNDATPGKLGTLQFKAGVLASEVTAARSGNDLVFSIAGTTDRITAQNFFYNSNPGNISNPLQQVAFDDGTVWNLDTIVRHALTGTSGNDAIVGTINADTLDGGAGNDSLNGGYGNNTYLFGRGDGQDTIASPDDGTPGKLNTLEFKAGVAATDVTASRNGNDLVFGIAGTPDRITAQNFFYNGNPAYAANPVQQVRFDDATTWDLNGILVKAFTAGPGNQTFYGALGSNTYTFGKGDGQDLITGFNDATPGKLGTLQFKAGVLASEVTAARSGNDLVFSIAGTADRITAQNFFYGGNPANSSNPLQQVKFDDGTTWDLNGISVKAFTAGPGNQTFYGALGNNTYTFGRGDGQDTIASSSDGSPTKLNTLQFKAGVSASEVTAVRNGDNLVLSIAGTADQITAQNFFYWDNPAGSSNPLQQVRFDDGTTWNLAALSNKAFAGTAGNDSLNGTYGADVLTGGAGNDTISGKAGNDFYRFGRGDGADVVQDWDSTAGNVDTFQLLQGIAADQVWLRRTGNDLELSIIGTADRTTVQNWYSGSSYHLEQFQTSDGHMLLDSQVQNLVQAMASFAPPPMGQTTLAPSYQSSLAPVIAANWGP